MTKHEIIYIFLVIYYIQGAVKMLKFVKITLFMSVLICAALLFYSGETHAAGYDVTLSGVVIYLSKAEASKMAENMEVNANWGVALGVVGIWLPAGVYKNTVGSLAALSQWKFRTAAATLRQCSARGATVTFPWVGIGGYANFQVKSR